MWDATSDEDHKSEMLDIIDHPENELILVAADEDGRLVGFLEASIRPYVEDCATDNVGTTFPRFTSTQGILGRPPSTLAR